MVVMTSLFARRPDLMPSVLLMFAAVAWGLFWIPMRYLHDAGFEGGWATSSYFGVSLLALAPIACARWRRLRAGGANLLLIGVLSGAALALYTLSFLYTTVVNALLIFYLTPVWSTLTGKFMLGESITPARVVALVLGLVGLWVILGSHEMVPVPSNPGDWMALSAGVIWAFAAVFLRRSQAHAIEFLNIFILGGFLVSLLVLVLRPEFARPPSFSVLSPYAIIALAAIAIASLPINVIILWAASLLSPGRVGLLMLLEVVCGIAVASVVTDEPYGFLEAVGTLLILGAGIVDTVRPVTATCHETERTNEH